MHELSGKEFHVGLTMSGAISAGAYTAGVLDFLIEALDAWEEARNAPNGETVPNHRVGIKVMCGASAGAITAAIGAISLADGGPNAGPFVKDGFTYRYNLPKLYEAWVVRPTLVANSSGVTDFLTFSDLDMHPEPQADFSRTSAVPSPSKNDPVPVVSLLNARLLDEIAMGAIAATNLREPPRPYVSQTLHVYITLSNLRGVPYRVPFDGGDYHMISHGNRVHYTLSGIGTWNTTSPFAEAIRSSIEEAGEINITMTSNVRGNTHAQKDMILPGVKNTIAVASGKGGVGKSTVAVNLAAALALDGAKVGMLDADIYGPSAPLMFGIHEKPKVVNNKLQPLERYGVKVMSIGFLVDPREAVIWRGPMASGAVKQFMSDVEWGELDYLIFDLPPGTGDIQLTLVQTIPLTGAVIVTTPQDVALADDAKGS